MNILFCGDAGVVQGIFLSMLSICKNADAAITFYILTASVEGRPAISQAYAEKWQRVLTTKNKLHRVILLDITDLFQNEPPLANMDTRFTPMCMLRLFADIVPEIPDRILYLDTDVLCCKDFRELYETDLSNYDIAGVPDRYGKWFFGNVLRHDYLNSGVLLLNMARIRQNGLFGACRQMCRDRKMFMPDQSSLNKLAVKRIIPYKYNNQGKMKQDTVLKHFTTFFIFLPRFKAVTIKPWQIEELHNKLKIYEFDDILEECQRSMKDEQRDPYFLYD